MRGIDSPLSGRVGLVVGATGALGGGMAQALGEAAAKVVITGRREAALETMTAKLQGLGVDVAPLVSDATDASAVREVVDSVVASHGSIDILVYAAGTTVRRSSFELTAEEWDQVHATNLRGAFLFSQAAGRVMAHNSGGKIIYVASLSTKIGMPNRVAYATSKAAMGMLAQSLAVEWAAQNIQVNAIAPGYFRTPLTEVLFEDDAWRSRIEQRIPSGRTGTPDELHGATVFLASSWSDYVTGQTLYVDGGFSAGELL